MGQSTDALLWWGYGFYGNETPWPDDSADNADDDPDWNDPLCRFHRLSGETGWSESGRLREEMGCEVVQHCSTEYTMYGVALSSTSMMAWRGHPRSFVELPMLPPGAKSRLDAFCRMMKINTKGQEPRWWLASNWS